MGFSGTLLHHCRHHSVPSCTRRIGLSRPRRWALPVCVRLSVGTADLAFLSARPCQPLFRSSTQETCAPAEQRPGRLDTTACEREGRRHWRGASGEGRNSGAREKWKDEMRKSKRQKKKEVVECSGLRGGKRSGRGGGGGGGGADRGEEGDKGGAKSGDLQVQLEQPVTLMVH